MLVPLAIYDENVESKEKVNIVYVNPDHVATVRLLPSDDWSWYSRAHKAGFHARVDFANIAWGDDDLANRWLVAKGMPEDVVLYLNRETH